MHVSPVPQLLIHDRREGRGGCPGQPAGGSRSDRAARRRALMPNKLSLDDGSAGA